MAVDVLSFVLRALGLVALLQAAGSAIARCLFSARLGAVRNELRRLTFVCALAAMALSTLHYALEAGRMAGELGGVLDAQLQELVAHSTLSTALVLRLTGLALIAAGARAGTRVERVLGAMGALIVAVSFVLTGHASVANASEFESGLLLLHVILAAFWIGILAPLFLLSRRDPLAARALAQDFSRLAIWLVPLIPVAGMALAVGLMEASLAWDNPYVWLLCTKLAGFAALMGIAASNKLRLGPALSPDDPAASRRLRRSLAVEYLLLVAVLAVTAFLTTFQSPEGR